MPTAGVAPVSMPPPPPPHHPPPQQVGLNAHRVLDLREWHRLATAPLLHADLPHLASNCTALVLEGLPLERRLGAPRFAALLASCTAVSQGLYREWRARLRAVAWPA